MSLINIFDDNGKLIGYAYFDGLKFDLYNTKWTVVEPLISCSGLCGDRPWNKTDIIEYSKNRLAQENRGISYGHIRKRDR